MICLLYLQGFILMINISKPYLPPIEEFTSYLTKIWSSGIVTNNGPFVQEFEIALKKYTGAKHAFFVSNGTIALKLAIRALNIKGQILTTPFSMIATLDSILWEKHEPAFADIDPETLNLDPDHAEKRINVETGCIIATHVYGNACNIERLEAITANRKIPLIFDASHAFGTRYNGRDIMTYGTVSTLSLQAFKILHSVEGGVVFTNDDAIAEKIFQMRYFGYDINMDVKSIGINGKSSEINAALGLCVLNHFDEVRLSRQDQSEYYDTLITKHQLNIKRPIVTKNSKFNYAYYAIMLPTEADVLRIQKEFEKNSIQFKRYFYPSLNTLNILKFNEPMPVSESTASRIICLPLYFDLTRTEQDLVIDSIVSSLK